MASGLPMAALGTRPSHPGNQPEGPWQPLQLLKSALPQSPLLSPAGAVLLDLDQKTLPGVAHQVVEQMIISDQIRAEDRANVLRALLLKHR